MFDSIKRKVKIVKISSLIIWFLFIFTVISNIFLLIKTYKLTEENIEIKKQIDGFKNFLHSKE